MKKISLKNISQVLSEKELKNVMGGSQGGGTGTSGCSDPGGNNYCSGRCNSVLYNDVHGGLIVVNYNCVKVGQTISGGYPAAICSCVPQ